MNIEMHRGATAGVTGVSAISTRLAGMPPPGRRASVPRVLRERIDLRHSPVASGGLGVADGRRSSPHSSVCPEKKP